MDEERVRQLIVDHQESVARYVARRLPQDEVPDVVAEVFVVAWRRPASMDGHPELPWLYGVARNIVAHRRRDHARRTRLHDRLRLLSADVAVGDPAESVASNDLMATAAGRLSPNERELLELISWERLTTDELAVLLRCSRNTVHQRIHRLRKNLKTHVTAIEQHELQATKKGMSND